MSVKSKTFQIVGMGAKALALLLLLNSASLVAFAKLPPAIDPGPTSAPEIDPGSIAGAITLLSTGVFMLTSRVRRTR